MSAETKAASYDRVETVDAVRYVPGESCGVLNAWCDAEPCYGCGPDCIYEIFADGRPVQVNPGEWVVRDGAGGLSVWTDSAFRLAFAASGGESA
jgi:hypothetical protein